MPPIPHSLPTILVAYGPALLALAGSSAAAWACRAKGRRPWLRTAAALACLLGWAALEPVARWRSALSPAVGPAMLLVPAAAAAALEAVRAWRGGSNDRLISVAAAGVVGWWLARVAASAGEFWRVWIITAALVWFVSWAVRQQAMRGLALALALWGGAVVAGFPAGWVVAAAVLAAAWAGLLALGAEAAVPSALVVAMLAGAELARGRPSRGHIDAADLVCLLALTAPFLAGAAHARLGKRWGVLAPALGAAGAVLLAWGIRRAVL